MIFYENFKKKIQESDIELKSFYRYGLELRKKITWGFTGLLMLAIGIIMMYEANLKHQGAGKFLLAGIVMIMGVSFFAMIWNYKMTIDTANGKIKHKKAEIEVSNIEKIVCKKMFSGKKIEPCLDIITKDKVEMIIPLIMNKKAEFVTVIKKINQDKFTIE